VKCNHVVAVVFVPDFLLDAATLPENDDNLVG
jgi:hypothetical protein